MKTFLFVLYTIATRLYEADPFWYEKALMEKPKIQSEQPEIQKGAEHSDEDDDD